jgi:hypothetical protein
MTLNEIIKTFMQTVDKFYVRKKDAGNLGKHYSVIIDFSKSDPGGMISYADDVDRAPMSLDWFNILGLKLCVLKDGKVLYYLNPDNVAKQINGAAADITTLGNDVMLEVPRMGTNCMWINRDKLKITITTAPNRAGYDYRAFSLHKYNDCDKIYIGRYEAYATGNKLYSSSGKTPSVSQTVTTYRTWATNRGTGYTHTGICDNILLQCIYLLITKNFNSQATIGQGISTGNTHNTGEANTFGWLNNHSTNKNSTTTAICCLGIENWWGNIWDNEDGSIKTADTNNILMAQYADQYNTSGTGYEVVATNIIDQTEHYEYQARCAGLPKFIFMPDRNSFVAENRSETTYMCDMTSITSNLTTLPIWGGSWMHNAHNGAFCRFYDMIAETFTSIDAGSRLVYKHVEGGGCLTLLIILSLNQMQLLRRLHLLLLSISRCNPLEGCIFSQ